VWEASQSTLAESTDDTPLRSSELARRRVSPQAAPRSRIRDPDAVLAVRPYVVPRSLRLQLPPLVVADTEEEFASASHGGRAITISFVGGHAGNQPCDDSYTASATPSRTAVAFIIRAIPVPLPVNTYCTSVGYTRTVTVHLTRPLGPRVLIDGADAIPVPVSHAHLR
jgi:hypothetical protein